MKTLDENEIVKRCVNNGLKEADVLKMLEIENEYMAELDLFEDAK